jgi:hypothetical protein
MRRIAPFGVACALVLASAGASAADRWVDRRQVLSLYRVSVDVGVGFGQYDDIEADPNNPTNIIDNGQKTGAGTSFEVAAGLPLGIEVGLRTGVRFGDAGINSNADAYARLFDKESFAVGGDALANPELRARVNVVDAKMVEVGVELRGAIPTATHLVNSPDSPHSAFALEAGVPVRLHLPCIFRVDTGFFVPVLFGIPGPADENGNPTTTTTSGFDLPVELWIQAKDFFFGPMTGLRYTQFSEAPDATDVLAGVGAGYTLFHVVDVKAQLYTPRINDSGWSKLLGGGLGVGLTLP